jgi:hypothetical protein
MPIIVTSRYGQNQPICEEDYRNDELASWQRERYWSNIRYVTVAIATHVRSVYHLVPSYPFSFLASDSSATCVENDDWVPVDPDDILARFNQIYDSPDIQTRHLVHDLHSLDLLDENGKENKIYEENGRKICRRGASIEGNSGTCGVLVNLRSISSLFTAEDHVDFNDSDIDNDDSDSGHPPPPQRCSTPLSLYPQAFLRDYGHIQAQGIVNIVNGALNKINNDLQRNHVRINDQSSDIVEEARFNVEPVVVGVSSQMYNAVQHRASTNAGTLDVQQGRISATLAGASATSHKNKRTAEQHLRYCRTKLPHNRFKERVRHEECPTSLRVENVFSIDMTQISPDDRDGETIYSTICSLADVWRHPEVIGRLKPHLMIFKPGVGFNLTPTPLC